MRNAHAHAGAVDIGHRTQRRSRRHQVTQFHLHHHLAEIKVPAPGRRGIGEGQVHLVGLECLNHLGHALVFHHLDRHGHLPRKLGTQLQRNANALPGFGIDHQGGRATRVDPDAQCAGGGQSLADGGVGNGRTSNRDRRGVWWSKR